MSRFSVKNILLGFGIGIVFMSIISIIYLAGMDPEKNLTEEEILKLAEKYDLVKRTDIINDGTTKASSSGFSSTATTGKSDVEEPIKDSGKEPEATTAATPPTAPTITPSPQPITTAEPITVTIGEGATSEKIAIKLYEAGLVNSSSEFVKLLGDMGLEDKIQVGIFKINKNASMKEIVELITK